MTGSDEQFHDPTPANDARIPLVARIAVFGYGSLVDPASAALTLRREVPPTRLTALRGWKRRWSIWRDNRAFEKTFAIEPGGEIPDAILGLNIEREDGPGAAGTPSPRGALVEVTVDELARLDLRELRYTRTDVTAEADAPDFDLVVAYVAKPGHLASEPPPGAVVLAPYLRTVEAAFAAVGPEELTAFGDSTGTPPVPVVEATLVRDEIPPGNPRGW